MSRIARTAHKKSRWSMHLKILLSVSLLVFLSMPLQAADKVQPRAAAIASAHPAATQAGHAILSKGGNAFDAAVTVSAVLAVVEPYSSGIGGGGFWLLQKPGASAVMVDGREKAPLSAHRDMYLDGEGNYIPGSSVDGPLAAGVPGSIAAMVHIAERYGKLPLSETLAPAIKAAREGFAVTAHYRRMASFRLEALRASKDSARIFLKDNQVPPLGHVIKQPELAETLARVAEQGAAGFYAGETAAKLVKGVTENGGIWQLDDLAEYQVVERAPIQFSYQSGDTQWLITSAAPPSSGGVALATILNILEPYQLADESNPVKRKHLIIEAMRRAYRDRANYLGDTDFVDVPIDRLTDKHYAAGLRAAIHPQKATPSDLLPGYEKRYQGTDTTHYSIVDRLGNRVSATLSINYPFGSAFTVPGTGVLLNDEMDDFAAKPGTPNVYGLVGAEANAIEPGKRMLSSMSPTLAESDKGLIVIGTPGGSRIITMVLLGLLDAMQQSNPEGWVSLPRFHHQYLPDSVQFEPGAFSEEEQAELQFMGHQLKPLDSGYGNMQAIWWDYQNGEIKAASDPRGEGQALVK